MNRIDRIITETINKFIRENVTNEVNNNLSFSEFDKTMSKLGFVKVYKDGPGVAYRMPNYPGEVSIHVPHDGSAKADMIRNTVKFLKSVRWFDNPENYKKFPFERWGVPENSIERDFTQDEILKANELYQDAEIYRVFYNGDNELCVIHTENGFNLCRNKNDRRPLYDTWFDNFQPGEPPVLKLDNFETMETEVYPINQDGTLDKDNMVVEGRRYR